MGYSDVRPLVAFSGSVLPDEVIPEEVTESSSLLNSHSVEQVMHGLFPKRVLDTVLDAMTDHEKLSLEVLDNETKSRAFALVILKMLKTAAGVDENALRGA